MPDDPGLRALLDGARKLRQEGRLDEAFAVVEDAFLRFPQDPLAHLAMANRARLQEDREAMRGHVDDALALAPDDPDTVMRATAFLLFLQEHEEAARLMDGIADADPARFTEPILAPTLRFVLALLDDDDEAAERHLLEAAEIGPRNAGEAQMLGGMLLDADKADEALAVVRRALQRDPGDARLTRLLDRVADAIAGARRTATGAAKGGAATPTSAAAAGRSSPWRRRLPDGEVLVVHGRGGDGKWRVSLVDGEFVAWAPRLADAVAELLDLDEDEPYPDWLVKLAAELDR